MTDPAQTSTAPSTARAVVIDTDLYSQIVLPGRPRGRERPDASAWREALLGHRLLIAVQTRVELLAIPHLAKQPWSEKRIAALQDHVNSAAVLQATEAVQDEFAILTGVLRTAGHALGAKVHTGDRWVAATALAHGLPVAAIDGIYDDVPGLGLVRP